MFHLPLLLLLTYAALFLCRVEYLAVNGMPASLLVNTGVWYFDTSAAMYLCALPALLLLLPYPTRFKRPAVLGTATLLNAAAIIAGIADSVYFAYTGRRTTADVFQEFAAENNLAGVCAAEAVRHWYLVLIALALIAAYFYALRALLRRLPERPTWRRAALDLLVLALYVPLTIAGIRGGFTTAVRPITVSNANQYVNNPQQAAAILNTPFSIIRTIGKHAFRNPHYMPQAEADALFTPLHLPDKTRAFQRRNVVVIIVESFGREYIGAYNRHLDGGRYRGFTPFVDSLMQHSLTFRRTLANGRTSIDGMPSVLSSIPMFETKFFLSPAAMNHLGGLARSLGAEGYHTAFFHGAQNGSMGFEAFAHATGFRQYYGRTEYDASPGADDTHDFDGMWAIWDEPFLQFYANTMSRFRQPFLTAVFTASSHHPYHIPQQYARQFPDDGKNTMHKCIRYTDNALRRFFHTASQQPWYRNTIFVITADHTNTLDHPEYATALGLYSVPIIIFDPQHPQAQQRDAIAQQIDIMPTVLGMLGYQKPYIAFGQDLTRTDDDDTEAVNYNNGLYQYIRGRYMLQFDGTRSVALYDIDADTLLERNILAQPAHRPQAAAMERRLKAIIQSYMDRMEHDRLVPGR